MSHISSIEVIIIYTFSTGRKNYMDGVFSHPIGGAVVLSKS